MNFEPPIPDMCWIDLRCRRLIAHQDASNAPSADLMLVGNRPESTAARDAPASPNQQASSFKFQSPQALHAAPARHDDLRRLKPDSTASFLVISSMRLMASTGEILHRKILFFRRADFSSRQRHRTGPNGRHLRPVLWTYYGGHDIFTKCRARLKTIPP